ncbi:inner membrane protein YpjD [Planctomycetota bacterium]
MLTLPQGTLLFLTMLLYLCSCLAYTPQWPKKTRKIISSPNILMGMALVLHTAFMFYYGVEHERAPIAHIFEALIFLGWCLAVVFFFFNFSYSTPTLSKYITPVIVVLFLVALVGMSFSTGGIAKVEGWLITHIVAFLFAYVLFSINFLCGTLYLVKEKRLKEGSDAAFLKSLPPLEVLDKLNLRALLLGFPVMTFGVFLGLLAVQSKSDLQHWIMDKYVCLPLLSWLCYGVILHMRINSQYRGRRVFVVTVASFIFLVVTFIGAFLVMPHYGHSFS